jgi:predicted trehalose synthase
MKQSDATRIVQLLTQLAESVNGPAGREPRAGTRLPLSDRVDRLDNRVSEIQLGLTTLAASTNAQFEKIGGRLNNVQSRLDTVDDRLGKVDGRLDTIDDRLDRVDVRLDKVDERFDAIDLQFTKTNQKIDDSAEMLKDLVERVHAELIGRIIDLEVLGPGGRGSGGRGSGGSGVPLAS